MAQIDLPSLILKNSLPGMILSEKRLSQYSLQQVTEDGYDFFDYEGTVIKPEENKNAEYILWLDTAIGQVLLYNGKPNALVGYSPENNCTLKIFQLQAVRPKKIDENNEVIKSVASRGLYPIDWQKVMVDCIEAIGIHKGYERLCIQSGYNNQWTKPYDGVKSTNHLTIEEALAKYDFVAMRAGFHREQDLDWYKSI